MSETREDRGLNLLAIDGGGARGLSALIILGALMERLQRICGLSDPPNPCDYFDLMAGTGTGGVQAVLLGRLRMSIEEAKNCYSKLASDVFSDKKLISLGGPVFKASKLEQILRSIIEQQTGDSHERMMVSDTSNQSCKVFVCAMSRHNMNAGIPCIMRTYVAPENQMPNYTICETLRATTAHPELFKSVELGEPPVQESFVDGGLGCSNPVEQLLAEAKLIFPGRHISSIVSIGAGHTRTIQIPKSGLLKSTLPLNALIAAKHIATDCERAAQEIARRFQNVPNVYFRFNVDQGLQGVGQSEWERLGEVMAHARAYLRLVETSGRLSDAAEAIKARKRVVATENIDGQLQMPPPQSATPVKTCPPPSPVFTGREDEIQQITSCFFGGAVARKVFVLHGLGGAGKTQIALRFIELTQDRFTDIIYVDATSQETIVLSLKTFAVVKRLGETAANAIEWLSTTQEPWLLVFNNADNSEVHLREYFPRGTHGNILVTTRSRDLALLSQGANAACQVSGLPPTEAMQLLFKTSRIQDENLAQDETSAGLELITLFGCLALAVVQAGAYIWRTGCGLTDYLNMYSKRHQSLLEEYKNMPVKVDDYRETVYTTWTMSYEQLGPRAAQLLHLISFFHHDNVPEVMFQRALEGFVDYEPLLPLDEHESDIHNWVKAFLDSFKGGDGLWDSQTFLSVVSEILSYSLIEYDRLNRVYCAHPLVHDWARATAPNSSLTLEHSARLLAMSVGLDRDISDFGFRRILMAHVDKIIQNQPRININNAARYVMVYEEAGRAERVEALHLHMLGEARKALGDESPGVLTLMANLAITYHDQGRWAEAETMFTKSLEPMKRVLGDNHPSVLMIMTNLAVAYKSRGRLGDAEALAAQAFGLLQSNITSKTTYVALFNLRTLCDIYRAQGNWNLAEETQIELLGIYKQNFGEAHPETLKCMGDLADTYTEQYRWDEAEDLQTHIVLTQNETLGPRHPNTLVSMCTLAETYSGQNKLQLADNLLTQVFWISQDVLGLRHPDTLGALDMLAATYGKKGNWEEAVPLFELALAGKKEVHGDEHRDTLSNMNNLAAAYIYLNRASNAKPLQEHVLLHRTRLLGEKNPDTLTSMNSLAMSCLKLGELEKAEALQLRAVQGRQEALGPDHPRTLTSIHNLGQVYLEQGRMLEAAEQELQVSNVMKRIYGKFHVETVSSMFNLFSMYLKAGLLKEAESVQMELLEQSTEVQGEGRSAT
ncbi:hypothetical protein FRC07_005340, partial [Ceratobasidium sp. 392]